MLAGDDDCLHADLTPLRRPLFMRWLYYTDAISLSRALGNSRLEFDKKAFFGLRARTLEDKYLSTTHSMA